MARTPQSHKKADQRVLADAREWFGKQHIDAAILVQTPTTREKDYSDAILEVREFLSRHNFNDFDSQGQGGANKVISPDASWITATGTRESEVAYYRPPTTKGGKSPQGDPRIRLGDVREMTDDYDVLVLCDVGGRLFIVNWSRPEVSDAVKSGASPIALFRAEELPEELSLRREVGALSVLSLENVKKKYEAVKNSLGTPPAKQPRVGYGYKRSGVVIAYTVSRAQCRCEVDSCNHDLFNTVRGEPYVEVHHIDMIAQGGLDQVHNTVALCPSHHREIHLGANRGALTAHVLNVRALVP